MNHFSVPYDNTPLHNLARGLFCSTQALLIHEPILHFSQSAKVLHEFYEWPKNRQESNIFFREVFRLKGFWGELGKRMTFNFFGHGLDIGVKLAVWQFFYGSTASYQEYSDYNAFKNMICGALAALPTCWTAIPGETASRAYYADKTWPLELRRNYKSPMNALLRIPFEEGPSYLFKGGLPIVMRDAIFFSYFFSIYSWLKNKLFFFWVYNDFSYDWIKLLMMSFSWASGCFVSYPPTLPGRWSTSGPKSEEATAPGRTATTMQSNGPTITKTCSSASTSQGTGNTWLRREFRSSSLPG